MMLWCLLYKLKSFVQSEHPKSNREFSKKKLGIYNCKSFIPSDSNSMKFLLFTIFSLCSDKWSSNQESLSPHLKHLAKELELNETKGLGRRNLNHNKLSWELFLVVISFGAEIDQRGLGTCEFSLFCASLLAHNKQRRA